MKLIDQCSQTFRGRRKVEYIGYLVSPEGLEAHPKYFDSIVNISFPRTLRSMQSVLGSLNYHSRFIEDFAIYELRKLISMRSAVSRTFSCLYQTPNPIVIAIHEMGAHAFLIPIHEGDLNQNVGGDPESGNRSRWKKIVIAFTLIKVKLLKPRS